MNKKKTISIPKHKDGYAFIEEHKKVPIEVLLFNIMKHGMDGKPEKAKEYAQFFIEQTKYNSDSVSSIMSKLLNGYLHGGAIAVLDKAEEYDSKILKEIDDSIVCVKCDKLPFDCNCYDDKNKLQLLAYDIQEWSDKTFGYKQRNPAILHHLLKEVKELIEAFDNYNKNDRNNYKIISELCHKINEEYADCFMLILDSASHYSFTTDSLIRITREKLEINKKRNWGKPDKNGVIEHL